MWSRTFPIRYSRKMHEIKDFENQKGFQSGGSNKVAIK